VVTFPGYGTTNRSHGSTAWVLPSEDFSALRYVRDQLQRTGQFQDLNIIAEPDDTGDLFGMLMRAAVKQAA
jgi:hypothetical protein